MPVYYQVELRRNRGNQETRETRETTIHLRIPR